MIFSSVTFLFLFLPVVFVLTAAGGKKYRNHVLLLGSLLFYVWGEGVFCLLLVGSILVNHILARLVEKHSGISQKFFLIMGIVANLGPLFVFKYAGFMVETVRGATGISLLSEQTLSSIHLPAGISFFTFQAISYLVDVYRKIVPAEQKIVNCGLYISMFPQLIAGPIVRYHDIAKQLVTRAITRASFAEGAERFIYGLGKKVLLADTLGTQADKIFLLPLADLSTPAAWLGAVCFSLQIYYDFSGYSDMAIGLGRMFGFRFPENFNYPYVSRSLREFWRRWHISLSAWLRDYLYIPLGGSRKGTPRTIVNLFVVFLLCGLWHGANWTFVVWGMWHGLFLVIERLVPERDNTFFTRAGGWVYTSVVVLTGWVVFRSTSLSAGLDYLAVMAGWGLESVNPVFAELMNDAKFKTELVAGFILATPVYAKIKLRVARPVLEGPATAWETAGTFFQGSFRLAVFSCVAYFSVLTIAARAYHPFLYFQF